ncbi:hypothetical protein J7E99_14795 [Streptomyces sp. ISL-44]|uniref:hypothetical protein n=1 Tax=Streptomyces sp. ISL-44 TaxID=2819184 RepID=UPI001BEA966A|nr:hypothetical protein [Streptomyces sp. ISL-44]MBT2541938.1 hypothetical protein [Streptomyces sp. ISL-44]
MATIPATQSFLAGEKVTASKLNAATKTVLDWLLNPPMAMATGTASTSALPTDGSAVVNSFVTEKFDTDNMVNLSTLADKITIQTSGLYDIDWSYGATVTSATVTVANTPGQVNTSCFLYVNTVPNGVTSARPIAGGSVAVAHGKTRLRLNAGDTLQIQTQTRLGTGTTAATVSPYNNYNTPHLAARFIAP